MTPADRLNEFERTKCQKDRRKDAKKRRKERKRQAEMAANPPRDLAIAAWAEQEKK